jgi:acetyltransferase-like isoleucine patch superfamily enzyme
MSTAQEKPIVELGEGTIVDPTATVGVIGRAGNAPVVIGAGSVIRSHTVIYTGVRAGRHLQTGHGALIREHNRIGDDVSIGTHATIEPGNVIGDRCRIQSGCFLERVTLGNDVFLGPHVIFTDDPHPPCPECTEFVGGATVEDGAAIGAGAMVGAGSVVTKDVPPGMVVAGNPARVVKAVAELVCRAKAAR